MNYGLFGKFVAVPGKQGELAAILENAALLLKGNSACVQYLIGFTSEPSTLFVFETWTSKEAHDASLQQEEVQACIKQAMPLILSAPERIELQVQGGKGI